MHRLHRYAIFFRGKLRFACWLVYLCVFRKRKRGVVTLREFLYTVVYLAAHTPGSTTFITSFRSPVRLLIDSPKQGETPQGSVAVKTEVQQLGGAWQSRTLPHFI